MLLFVVVICLPACVFYLLLNIAYYWQFGMLQSPYAQLLAATTLTKLISRPNVTLPLEQRIDISMYTSCYVDPQSVMTDLSAMLVCSSWFISCLKMCQISI